MTGSLLQTTQIPQNAKLMPFKRNGIDGAAGDWTPDFSHAKRALYLWVTTPSPSWQYKRVENLELRNDSTLKIRNSLWKGGTQVWTGDPSICSRMLYHWAIPPYGIHPFPFQCNSALPSVLVAELARLLPTNMRFNWEITWLSTTTRTLI